MWAPPQEEFVSFGCLFRVALNSAPFDRNAGPTKWVIFGFGEFSLAGRN